MFLETSYISYIHIKKMFMILWELPCKWSFVWHLIPPSVWMLLNNKITKENNNSRYELLSIKDILLALLFSYCVLVRKISGYTKVEFNFVNHIGTHELTWEEIEIYLKWDTYLLLPHVPTKELSFLFSSYFRSTIYTNNAIQQNLLFLKHVNMMVND